MQPEITTSRRKNLILDKILPVTLTARDGTQRLIRHLRTDDGPALARFYEAIPAEDQHGYCPHPLDREHALDKAARADDANFVCLVVETPNGEIGGYAWYRWKQEDAQRSSFGICMRRDHQGLGLGRRIMETIIAAAEIYGPPVMSLTVQPETNPGAYKLYSSLGFQYQRQEIRKKYGDLNYHMSLRLHSAGAPRGFS